MDAHKTQRMALTLFLEKYKDGDKLLYLIVQVTGDETWFHMCNFKPKSSQTNRYTRIQQTSRKSLNKHRLPASRLTKIVSWDGTGQKTSVDDRIHATKDSNDVRSVV
jgi:hypothetical protein